MSQILQADPPPGYFLTRKACLGILRRAAERGKPLPTQLKIALELQAGLRKFIPAEWGKGPIAFAANQRDEVRDLHNVAGALGAQPGMKQQTFISQGCLNPWDTQQARVFTPDSTAPTLAGADGGGGRNPGGLLFSAGFCAGAAPTAGGIGYQDEIAPTLKAAESGTNMVPSVLCLNDQGGSVMECTENISGTLRAQEHGHQPLVFENHALDARYTGPYSFVPTLRAQGQGHQPLVFENHGVDARYKGPLPVVPTLSARAGTGGNNLPLVSTVATVFSRQRTDHFREDAIASTESTRQFKDATDLVYQETVGALTSCDFKGPNSQYVSQDKCVVTGPYLIRRLTPLECERLQGYPDGWTDLPGASDSARYKALGNSVCIPCVEFVMRGIALVEQAA